MLMEYWTYTVNETDETGKAYINMVAALRMEEPPEGSTIVWGTFLPKIAGTKASFDVGLCKLGYSSDELHYEDEDHWPEIEDFWYAGKEWFKNDKPPAVQAQELLDCAPAGYPDLTCKDVDQNGTSNWASYHDPLEPPWNIRR
jgi:hypothetical protein